MKHRNSVPSALSRFRHGRRRVVVGIAATGMLTAAPLGVAPWASGSASAAPKADSFVQTNLISDLSTEGAQIVDPDLLNPWGLAFDPMSLWVSDNNGNVSTVYGIAPGGLSATPNELTVNIPGGRASTGDGSSPTGQVFNSTSGFVVSSSSGSGPAAFITDSESGQITGWNPAAGLNNAVLEFSSRTAVYKGLAIATGDQGTFLYAANFHDRSVDVFNSSFQPTQMPGGFTDPSIPSNYAPFGIQDIHNLIYVSYAQQDASGHDDVPGIGHGFIDVYTPDGFLVQRLAKHGLLNSPWGMAIAPSTFGQFAGKLLVGNFRDGRINVFDPVSGRFMGQVKDTQGKPITIPGLWALTPGTATQGGTGTIIFSAGINDENDGLVGSLNPAS
ncbi:MAG: TIGR03118 family protein [Acidimicrobiaceae bacterium]|nr:TIGR03118 family protein [Acidimicrobiaceae bacterium]